MELLPSEDEYRYKIRLVKFWLLLAAGILFLATSEAKAAVFVDTGQSCYDMPGNGVYWQNGHPYNEDMCALYLRVGVAGDVGPVTLRGSLFDLGKYTLDARATPFDHQYNPDTPNYCNGECPPLNHWITSGGVRGLSFTVSGKWKFLAVEAGPTLFRQQLSMNVYHPNGEPVDGYNVEDMNEYGVGYVLGVGVEIDHFRFGVAKYSFDSNYNDPRLSEGDMPSGVGPAYVMYVGYLF